ncbi:transporter [Nocardiopsis sp. TSRI0078]|uniref:ABC transporter permease n=1 Tax=unclassified Nocardiopsis TaxID=2649073 RepID=UPI00093FE925|nr:ABC-2 family transporter protein [Nocardiopsis sp. TSRI0078]OKI22382.1 transporter [Nocardiopsis sp. TSRI0078]
MADVLARARGSVLWPVRAYLLLAWTWCRALAQYPVSLLLMTLATSLGVFAEIGAVVVVFVHAGRLEGFDLAEGLLVAGLAATAFSCADMILGMVENLGRHIRAGTLDVMLVRPVSPLVQMATDRFAPRRLGRIVPGAVIVTAALVACDIDWTLGRALMLPVLLVSGTAICCSVWVLGACLQFFVADAREAANSVTYGGQALTEYPLAVYGRDVVRAVTFVVPLAFVTWQPALYLLGRPDPTGLPDALRFTTPLVAVAMCLIAAACWRSGLRHYRSTGS